MKKIKLISIFALTSVLMASCSTMPEKKTSLVGVWEMCELKIAKMSQAPRVAITNKKDIFGEDGVYHDTAADSTKMTDVSVRTYKFKDGELSIYRADGREQKSRRCKIRFLTPEKMEMTTPSGNIIIFKKISDDPKIIPKLKERIVPVRMQ